MPKLETMERFIKAVETEPHDQVIAEFYAEDASIQENQSTPRAGREKLIEYERMILSKAIKVDSQCIRPYIHSEDKVAIKWVFRFEWKDHTVSEIEEVVYQEWSGEKIKKEQFFYDPSQFIPKKLK